MLTLVIRPAEARDPEGCCFFDRWWARDFGPASVYGCVGIGWELVQCEGSCLALLVIIQ